MQAWLDLPLCLLFYRNCRLFVCVRQSEIKLAHSAFLLCGVCQVELRYNSVMSLPVFTLSLLAVGLSQVNPRLYVTLLGSLTRW